MNFELIATFANISLTLSVAVAIVFGIAQVRDAARNRKEKLTLETLRNFQTREFAECVSYVMSRDIPNTLKELRSRTTEEQVMFTHFAQQMESLGILVADNLVDLDLVDKTHGSLVSTAWHKYEKMFLSMRGEDPFIGEYFQWLAEQVERRLKENPRKPMYKFLAKP